MSVVVDEGDVQRVVDVILTAGSTKSVGDGKISVHPIEGTIDISTGEDERPLAEPLKG